MGKRIPGFAIAIAAAVLFAWSGIASAAAPTREPVEYPPEGILLPAGSACEFDLLAQFPANREYSLSWLDADGNPIKTLTTGRLTVLLTNLDTDQSIFLNISGPGQIIYNSDGTVTNVFLGRGVVVLGGVFYASIGRHVYLTDADFNVLDELQSSGQQIDICAILS